MPLNDTPILCECGCGQTVSRSKWPSHQKRFVSGHNRRTPLEVRFWKRVDRSGGPNACWLWLGPPQKESGYGITSVGDQRISAHRASYQLHYGPIPDGFSVLHHCDNRLCVNPAHLFLGTHDDNMADMVSKGRHYHGPRPHKGGENNHLSKLTTAQVLEIRERVASGERQKDIAAEFHLNASHVSDIIRRASWKHI